VDGGITLSCNSKRNWLKLMAKVIVFSGIDGSGKTAHACKLAYELRSCGKSVKYLWLRGRGRVFLSLPLLILCRLLGITKVHKLRDDVRVSEYPFHMYKPIRLLWPWLQLIDSFLYSMVVHNFLSRSCDLIIMDRSPIDTLVDIIADTQAPASNSLLQRLFLALIPKTSLVVILDVRVEVAMGRKKDIPNIRYLKPRKRAYENLAKEYGWYILSTETDFNTVHNILLKLVDKILNMDFV
jgi:thymidylate kinase